MKDIKTKIQVSDQHDALLDQLTQEYTYGILDTPSKSERFDAIANDSGVVEIHSTKCVNIAWGSPNITILDIPPRDYDVAMVNLIQYRGPNEYKTHTTSYTYSEYVNEVNRLNEVSIEELPTEFAKADECFLPFIERRLKG